MHLRSHLRLVLPARRAPGASPSPGRAAALAVAAAAVLSGCGLVLQDQAIPVYSSSTTTTSPGGGAVVGPGGSTLPSGSASSIPATVPTTTTATTLVANAPVPPEKAELCRAVVEMQNVANRLGFLPDGTPASTYRQLLETIVNFAEVAAAESDQVQLEVRAIATAARTTLAQMDGANDAQARAAFFAFSTAQRDRTGYAMDTLKDSCGLRPL